MKLAAVLGQLSTELPPKVLDVRYLRERIVANSHLCVRSGFSRPGGLLQNFTMLDTSSIRVGATGGGIKKGPMVQQLGEELSTQMLACIITHHNAACGLSSDEGPQPDVVAEGEQHKPDEEQILEQLLDPDAEQQHCQQSLDLAARVVSNHLNGGQIAHKVGSKGGGGSRLKATLQ